MVVLEPAANNPQVGQFEKLELGLKFSTSKETKIADFVRTGRGINPYDPEQVDLFAIFTSPSGKEYRVNGFYYEDFNRNAQKSWDFKQVDFRWRIRFAPNELGGWKVKVKSVFNQNNPTEEKELSFVCINSSNEGYITTGNDGGLTDRYLRYSGSKKTFFAIGENMTWSGGDFNAKSHENHHKWLRELSENGGNFVRIGLVPWGLCFEWSRVGNYQGGQTRLWEMDQILEKCEDLGLYINLHMNIHDALRPPAWLGNRYGWDSNPYHNDLEGVNEPIDFFTDKEARKYYKRHLRYLYARWGYSTNIAVWELFSEIDKAVLDYNDVGENTELVNQWFIEMRDYIKQDMGDTLRPVSVSFSTGENVSICEKAFAYADIAFNHDYGRDERQNYENRYDRTRKFIDKTDCTENKPFMHQEVGGGFRSIDSVADITFHNAIWGTSFAGNFGCGLNWWWDFAIHPTGAVKNFKPLAVFFEDQDLVTINYQQQRWSSRKVENLALAAADDGSSAIGWAHNRSYWWPNLYSTNKGVKTLIDANSGAPYEKADNTKYADWRDADVVTPYENAKVVVKGMKPSGMFNKNYYKVKFYSTRGDGGHIPSMDMEVKSDMFGRVSFEVTLDDSMPDVAYKIEWVQ